MPRITTTKKSLGDRVADAADRVGQGVNQFMDRQAQMAQLKQQQEELAMRKEQMIAQREAQAKQVKIAAANGLIAMHSKILDGGPKAAEAMRPQYQQLFTMQTGRPMSDDDYNQTYIVDGEPLGKMSKFVEQGFSNSRKIPTLEGQRDFLTDLEVKARNDYNFLYTPSKAIKEATLGVIAERRQALDKQIAEKEKAKTTTSTGTANNVFFDTLARKEAETYESSIKALPGLDSALKDGAELLTLLPKVETGQIAGSAPGMWLQKTVGWNKEAAQRVEQLVSEDRLGKKLQALAEGGAKAFDSNTEMEALNITRANPKQSPEVFRITVLAQMSSAAKQKAKTEALDQFVTSRQGTPSDWRASSPTGNGPEYVSYIKGNSVIALPKGEAAPKGYTSLDDEFKAFVEKNGDAKGADKNTPRKNKMQAAPTTQGNQPKVTKEDTLNLFPPKSESEQEPYGS